MERDMDEMKTSVEQLTQNMAIVVQSMEETKKTVAALSTLVGGLAQDSGEGKTSVTGGLTQPEFMKTHCGVESEKWKEGMG